MLSDASFASEQGVEDRITFDIRRVRLSTRSYGFAASGITPPEPLSSYHVSRVDVRASLEETPKGVGSTFAFRTRARRDLDRAVRRTLKKARGQLPQDRSSIAVIDAYEALFDLPKAEIEDERQRIYASLQDELRRHSRPTGLLLAAPEPDQQPRLRSYVYIGNPSPASPFPPGFRIGDWDPESSETVKPRA